MRPMSRIALLAAVAFAALTGTAHAGGWATVELGETPSGLVAGEPWRVELIVKQHGLTPLEGVVPSVRIDNGEGVVKTFTARPTDRVGTYVAEVDFPAGGTWRARVYDGFTDAFPHRLSPLTVSPAGGHSKRLPVAAGGHDRRRRSAVPRRHPRHAGPTTAARRYRRTAWTSSVT
jgi:hypothetical protein